LRSLRELEADRPVVLARGDRDVERAQLRRARIAVVVAREGADVVRPRHAARVVERRLEADQRRLALAREDDEVVPLHRQKVGEVEDVVGGAHDQRVEVLLGHERANALELRVVARPAHSLAKSCRR
jgi:hypothetical protein